MQSFLSVSSRLSDCAQGRLCAEDNDQRRPSVTERENWRREYRGDIPLAQCPRCPHCLVRHSEQRMSRSSCGAYVETLARLLTSSTLGSSAKGNGCPGLFVFPFEKIAGRSLRIWAAPIEFSLVWTLLLDSFEHGCQITLTVLLWSLREFFQSSCEHKADCMKHVRHHQCAISSREWKGGLGVC